MCLTSFSRSPVNPHDMQATPPTVLLTRHDGVLSVCRPQEMVCQPALGDGRCQS